MPALQKEFPRKGWKNEEIRSGETNVGGCIIRNI
jgi:hypothetical protein